MEIKVRQVVPLALLNATDEQQIEGRTRFQKLVFLTEERLSEQGMDLYDFIKYDYGPFSKDLLDDLEWLEDKGWIEIDANRTFSGNRRYDYTLTDAGGLTITYLSNQDSRAETISEIASGVVDEYNSWSIRRLLDYIYESYPEYQEKSVYY